MDKLILTFIWKGNRAIIAKIILKKNLQVTRLFSLLNKYQKGKGNAKNNKSKKMSKSHPGNNLRNTPQG